jgi:uncharacterized cofD-like protein
MNNHNNNKLNVVVMGGGTGIYPVTTAFKQLPVTIRTIIAVSDSGGSTGRIRDEFGFQPVGDLRQSLAALAEGQGEEWIRKLLLYRFPKGEGLKGHNLGNLILTALQDMTGDTSEALNIARHVFRLKGEVIPATKDNVDIEIHYEDGSKLVGEDYLNPESEIQKRVISIGLQPSTQINPYAAKAIKEADVIVIGPGDFYASLLATIVPEGTKQAFIESQAKIYYVVNLMTRHFQTDNMKASDHVKGIEAAIGRAVDGVLINNEPIPREILENYQKSHEEVVIDDLSEDTRVHRANIIGTETQESTTADALHRSFLRHDSAKLRTVFAQLLNFN